MAKPATAAQSAAALGTDAIYRKLFDSFNPGKDGLISHWEVLTRLQRSGLQPDDPRIAEALAGLKAADGASGRGPPLTRLAGVPSSATGSIWTQDSFEMQK